MSPKRTEIVKSRKGLPGPNRCTERRWCNKNQGVVGGKNQKGTDTDLSLPIPDSCPSSLPWSRKQYLLRVAFMLATKTTVVTLRMPIDYFDSLSSNHDHPARNGAQQSRSAILRKSSVWARTLSPCLTKLIASSYMLTLACEYREYHQKKFSVLEDSK